MSITRDNITWTCRSHITVFGIFNFSKDERHGHTAAQLKFAFFLAEEVVELRRERKQVERLLFAKPIIGAGISPAQSTAKTPTAVAFEARIEMGTQPTEGAKYCTRHVLHGFQIQSGLQDF